MLNIKKNNKETISLIVPCYNEEESLPLFYETTKKLMKKMSYVDFELLFINDGSKDKTLEILRNFAKKDKRVRYISFSRNFGKEAGMFAGLENAKGDYVAIMDADMQDPPEMIEKMYKIITEEKYDCAALYTKSHDDYTFLRKIFTKIWYKVIGMISSIEQIPGARDFRLMTRKMADAVISIKEYNRYTKGIFSFVGFDTKWIDYNAPNRVAGKTKFNFIKLFKYALEGMVAFSTTPLVISSIIGLIFCIISVFAIIFIIIKTLVFGDPVSGWPSLACILIFVSGVQLFFLGVIGIYLSKTYLEIKERPIYIIKETEDDIKN